MNEVRKISALVPKSRKISFNSGRNILTKTKFCNERNDKRLCNRCNNQINENKELEAKLNLVKRQPHNEFGHMLPYFMLPYFKQKDDLFVIFRL